MSYLSNYQYYLNSDQNPTDENWGSYQYVSLKDIVKNFKLIYTGPDKAIDNVENHIIRFHAKQAIKHINYDGVKEVRAIEYTIGSNLKMAMPHDYVDYVRLSLCRDGVLLTMTENNSPIISSSYLQDNDNEVIIDNQGSVIVSDKRLEVLRNRNLETSHEYQACTLYKFGGRFGLDASKANRNPKFSIRKRSGVIDFESGMDGESVVLEYISDGMESGDDSMVMIHKFFEKYVYLYISYEILDTKYGVPVVTRENARRRARSERNNSKIRAMDLDPSKLTMALRGQHNWLK